GGVSVIDSAGLPVRLPAGMPPKRTAGAPMKLVPAMGTTVLPAVLPLVVAMVLLDGAVATLSVKRSNDDRADEPARVLTTSQRSAVCGGVATVSCVEEVTSTPPKVTFVMSGKLVPVIVAQEGEAGDQGGLVYPWQPPSSSSLL